MPALRQLYSLYHTFHAKKKSTNRSTGLSTVLQTARHPTNKMKLTASSPKNKTQPRWPDRQQMAIGYPNPFCIRYSCAWTGPLQQCRQWQETGAVGLVAWQRMAWRWEANARPSPGLGKWWQMDLSQHQGWHRIPERLVIEKNLN